MKHKTFYTVVVADDEDELREAVCSMIPWEDCGFQLVGSASNGLDALQLVEKLEPDLLLTDIRMPFISGIELARQVREVRPATNIAFLSGFDDFEYAQQAIQYNIISYMLKPLTVEGLGNELRIIRQKIDAQFAMFRQAPPRQKARICAPPCSCPSCSTTSSTPRETPIPRPMPGSAASCAKKATGPSTPSWSPPCSARTARTEPRPPSSPP